MQLLQIGGETKGIREARQVTTAMAQIIRKNTPPKAEGEETGRRTHLEWLAEHKKALTIGQSLSELPKLLLGQGQKLKKGEGKKEKTKNLTLANDFQRKKTNAIYCSEYTLWTQLHNFIWQLKT